MHRDGNLANYLSPDRIPPAHNRLLLPRLRKRWFLQSHVRVDAKPGVVFVQHLQDQFTQWMTWQSYGVIWQEHQWIGVTKITRWPTSPATKS